LTYAAASIIAVHCGSLSPRSRSARRRSTADHASPAACRGCTAIALPHFTVASEAVLSRRPRVAIGLPHFFENLEVLALEPATDDGVVGIGDTGDHPQHLRRRLVPIGRAVRQSAYRGNWP